MRGRCFGGVRGVGGTSETVTVYNSADAPAPPPKEAAKAKTGEVAVRQSKRDRAQQEAMIIEGEVSSEMRKVGDKTFYFRDDVWTDSEFKADAKLPETAIEFGGEEYFALIKREPQLARFFSLGERVVVVYNGRVYRVTVKP